MKKLLIICMCLLSTFNLNATSRLQLLLGEYCRKVSAAYHSGDPAMLEDCIKEYEPVKYRKDGPYISYKDTTLRISVWKELEFEGFARPSKGTFYSFIPPEIDLYLAKGQNVKANPTPLLRDNYDFIYSEVYVKANGTVSLKAKDVGKWKIVAACAYKANISITLCDASGANVSMSLNYDNPVSTMEWQPDSDEVEITLTNHSNMDVSVFIAKN